MTREKFPEKIPFRLTRMLTNAMEVGPLFSPLKPFYDETTVAWLSLKLFCVCVYVCLHM